MAKIMKLQKLKNKKSTTPNIYLELNVLLIYLSRIKNKIIITIIFRYFNFFTIYIL